jgi:hypothetical protein
MFIIHFIKDKSLWIFYYSYISSNDIHIEHAVQGFIRGMNDSDYPFN